jgi:DNA-binding XRE family transcriptional regulator
MNKIPDFQVILSPQGEKLAIPPLEDLEKLVEELEMAEAVELHNRIKAGEEETFPESLVIRIIDNGESPLKVFREYRGLTQEQLAEKAGTTKNYISQIENRRRHAGRKLLKRLAQALNLSPEDLADERAD